MNITNEPLEPHSFYHIYNRGINSVNIFNEEKNYHFFLEKFSKYLDNVCDVYAYCLMPNHFHFLIRIKAEDEITKKENFTPIIKNEFGLHSSSNYVSKQIGKCISSYTQAFNKYDNRHGPLLESPFKRKKIVSEEYLKRLIIYIHHNPKDLNTDFTNYKFSSYKAMVSKSKTKLQRDEIMTLFEGLENFVYCHEINLKEEFTCF